MSELGIYVDKLFSGYSKSCQNEEMKAEILGNLEAKKADLLSSGLNELEATQKAKESITSIDFLIDGNRQVYSNRLKLELAQWRLIIILMGWILTIPLLFFHPGVPVNGILLAAVLLAGFYYLGLYKKQAHTEGFLDETRYLNLQHYKMRRKVVWILWIIFAAINLLGITALYFGSNIWFSRKVSIDGPYAFASMLITYFIPMLTIIIPIIVGIPVKLISKCEVADNDEK